MFVKHLLYSLNKMLIFVILVEIVDKLPGLIKNKISVERKLRQTSRKRLNFFVKFLFQSLDNCIGLRYIKFR